MGDKNRLRLKDYLRSEEEYFAEETFPYAPYGYGTKEYTPSPSNGSVLVDFSAADPQGVVAVTDKRNAGEVNPLRFPPADEMREEEQRMEGLPRPRVTGAGR